MFMVNLLFRTVVLGLLSGCVVVLLALGLPNDADNYFAAAIDKNKTAYERNSIGVMFVGGSNVAFGIDAEVYSRQLHTPTVNLGLHANLGMRYMLAEAASVARPGDTLMVIPEYQQFLTVDANGGSLEIALLVQQFPDAFNKLEFPNQWVTLAKGIPRLAESRLDVIKGFVEPNRVYRRSAFDTYGNMVGHLDLPPTDVTNRTLFEVPVEASDFNDSTLNELVAFRNRMSARGVSVLVSFPAIPARQFRENQTMIRLVELRLRQALGDAVIGKPDEFAFEGNCFFDSVYHVMGDCRRARNEQLLAHLMKRLDTHVVPAGRQG
jgi:hypothetical protein